MEISQALQIVLDLAKQNVIDECDEPEEHAQQMAAISTVEGTIVEHVLKTMRSNKNFWGPGRTREDFLRQGRASARMGNTRSPGNEYWMPQFGTGDSWQAKAFAEGFREECARLGQRVKGEVVSTFHCLVFSRDALDEEQAANYAKPWLMETSTGIEQFDTEGEACARQKEYRIQHGKDPMTGE